jgi:hypothetical protein
MILIELCCIVVAVASVMIAMRVNRIAKLLEQQERRQAAERRVRDLEPLKP